MSCSRALQYKEDCICTFCHYQLPETDFHLQLNNPVAKLFWGRAPIHAGASLYRFSKRGKVQRLVHGLKYQGRQDVGIALGRLYGVQLKQSDLFKMADVVVPVPLHPIKMKKRGYNQSACFAQGIAQGMGVAYNDVSLKRVMDCQSQTSLSRFERWENIKSAFAVCNDAVLKDKHVLLVDDVVTTGSTLESCVGIILNVPGTTVSVATLSYAEI